ncbi:hypothetical protein F4859DRAFT_491770 [Xylaria cf. heliscus]|nr:hypothetical protein F4859DRAFT_491770 [Xylaria cf. heliscus]
MHGILAVGALSRDIVPSRFSGRPMSLIGCSSSYPLRKYNQAIQELSERLDASCRSREHALIGGLIFAVVEAYQGRDEMAQMHIHSALSILKSLENTTAGETQCPPDLYRLLHCLSSHSRVNHQPFSSVIRRTPAPIQALQFVSGFRTISEARDSLNSINGSIHSLYRSRVDTRESSRLHSTASLAGATSGLARQLDLWYTHFSALRASSTVDAETTTCIQILLLHYQIAKLCLSSELGPDIYTRQFWHITELSADILRAEERSRAVTTKPQPGHSLDVALAQPLFYTACKCKDGIVRRRAIELLETVDGASLYDTQLLARVARWVMAIEEKAGLESGHSGGVVKEEDMLHDIEVDVADEAGMCNITAWRRDNGSWSKVSGYVHAG